MPLKTQVYRRGNTYAPELRLAPGPRSMGDTGDGSYATLCGYAWAGLLDRVERRFRLFQAQVPGEGPWALDDPRGPDVAVWIEVEVPPLPHPAREVRHLAFCFDQAARHVVAYEREGQVFVRQWDPVAGAYTMRGPFPGVDPVLLWDYEVGYFLGDSDVLLFHLSPDRTQVIMRVQRELYANPRVVQALPGPAYLDQALALPYQAEVLGSLDADPDTTSLVLRTDLYPVYFSEVAASSVAMAPVEWNYIFAPPWILQNLGTEVAASASVTAPTAWDYPLAVVIYNGGVEAAASASVTAPTNWNYYV